uniref:SUF system FeS cluster assembly SufBD core domain-containing protein n=1 Tax=Alexandrium catenella TaxID=2925 RepID=A0A7S1L978_ALECA
MAQVSVSSMSTGCVSGCQQALLASYRQPWTTVPSPPLPPRCRTEQQASAPRRWSRSTGSAGQRPTRWREWLGATAASLAAATSRARRARRPPTCRKADSRRADSADRWFQSLLEDREGQPFDAALSERGAAALGQAAPPLGRQEPWRYTDLDTLLYADQSPIDPLPDEAQREALSQLLEDKQDGVLRLVFIDGTLSSEFSSSQNDGENCFVGGREALRLQGEGITTRVNDLLQPLPEVDMMKFHSRDSLGCAKLAALNQALFKDCACVCIPSDSRLEEHSAPTEAEVVFVSTGSLPSVCSPRVLIDVGRNQRLHVVESHLSLDPRDTRLTNGICRVLVAEGAEVVHDLLQQRAEGARFVGSLAAEVAERASYKLRVVQTGSRTARLNVMVLLAGEAATCDASATMVASDKQQLDLHSLIHHRVAGCSSKQQHKNIVGDTAECIFKGSITVDKEAQQTKSSQICRSLLLSKKAKVKAMPCLQIRADDVACSHGAAVTELDEKQVFYLASRGLDGGEARSLLLTAFPQDLLAGLRTSSPKANDRVLEKLKSLAASQASSRISHIVH